MIIVGKGGHAGHAFLGDSTSAVSAVGGSASTTTAAGGGRGRTSASRTTRGHSISTSGVTRSKHDPTTLDVDLLAADMADNLTAFFGADGREQDDLPLSMNRAEPRQPRPGSRTPAPPTAADADDDSLWVAGARGYNTTTDDGSVWASAPKRARIKIEGEEITSIDDLAAKKYGVHWPGTAPAANPEEDEIQAQLLQDDNGSDDAPVPATPPVPTASKTPDPPPPRSRAAHFAALRAARHVKLGARALEDLVALPAHERDGQPFLFQVLQALPPLHPDSSGSTTVKPDPDGDDIVILSGGAKTSIDLTVPAGEVIEEDLDAPASAAARGGSRWGRPERDIGPHGGFLGKMVVRRSGAVELSWGGYPCRVVPLERPDRPVSGVLIEEREDKPGSGGRRAGEYDGTAYDVGDLRRKYNVVPFLWDEMERWKEGKVPFPPPRDSDGR
jgi:DNA-directed RNA polymerase III subunit RPC4